jgi:hypothetical protein
MAGGKGYTFSTDSEEEMNEWINAFNAALKKNHDQENNQNDEALDKGTFFAVNFFLFANILFSCIKTIVSILIKM